MPLVLAQQGLFGAGSMICRRVTRGNITAALETKTGFEASRTGWGSHPFHSRTARARRRKPFSPGSPTRGWRVVGSAGDDGRQKAKGEKEEAFCWQGNCSRRSDPRLAERRESKASSVCDRDNSSTVSSSKAGERLEERPRFRRTGRAVCGLLFLLLGRAGFPLRGEEAPSNSPPQECDRGGLHCRTSKEPAPSWHPLRRVAKTALGAPLAKAGPSTLPGPLAGPLLLLLLPRGPAEGRDTAAPSPGLGQPLPGGVIRSVDRGLAPGCTGGEAASVLPKALSTCPAEGRNPRRIRGIPRARRAGALWQAWTRGCPRCLGVARMTTVASCPRCLPYACLLLPWQPPPRRQSWPSPLTNGVKT
ncbi:transmembrane gamma-carboxyglutamic acid protein 3 isoform 1-T3 [Liasis olivaceus]